MPDTLLMIERADLSALLSKIDNLTERLNRVEVTPLPRFIPLDEYARKIGRHPQTVRRNLHTVESRVECGVTMIRNPDAQPHKGSNA